MLSCGMISSSADVSIGLYHRRMKPNCGRRPCCSKYHSCWEVRLCYSCVNVSSYAQSQLTIVFAWLERNKQSCVIEVSKVLRRLLFILLCELCCYRLVSRQAYRPIVRQLLLIAVPNLRSSSLCISVVAVYTHQIVVWKDVRRNIDP